MITGPETKLMAVIGDPIGHSLSPFLHSQIIREAGLDAVYLPFLVKAGETGKFTEAARLLKLAGFNATMPHKNALAGLVDELDPEAESYGSVNTVKVLPDGRLRGYNTDVRGLFMAFERHGVKVKDSRIMIIGAGGVAGALIRGCAEAGAESVTMVNRTFEKAAALCGSVPVAKALEWTGENMSRAAAEADVIVNCTSLGMSGTGMDFEDLSFLDDSRALICDLIYNPWETRFLKHAASLGLRTMNGMDMLIYQGLLAFEIFMDVSLDLHSERDRLLPLCRERLTGASE
ncbi:MAG: shikimate dehydrogenase [Clostridia bacterium]|nr:shikimate dehydrogenase [Clostridia bacterium]